MSLCVLPSKAPLQKRNFSKNFSRGEVVARTPDTGKCKCKCYVYILELCESWQMKKKSGKKESRKSFKMIQSFISYLQGCHFPDNMKFPDFSRPRLSSTVSSRPFRGV